VPRCRATVCWLYRYVPVRSVWMIAPACARRVRGVCGTAGTAHSELPKSVICGCKDWLCTASARAARLRDCGRSCRERRATAGQPNAIAGAGDWLSHCVPTRLHASATHTRRRCPCRCFICHWFDALPGRPAAVALWRIRRHGGSAAASAAARPRPRRCRRGLATGVRRCRSGCAVVRGRGVRRRGLLWFDPAYGGCRGGQRRARARAAGSGRGRERPARQRLHSAGYRCCQGPCRGGARPAVRRR
jgi:hypothetical protein